MTESLIPVAPVAPIAPWIGGKKNLAKRILSLYVKRLEEIFSNVAPPSLVRNTKGAPLYYLIWAGSNARGLPIADHILGLGEKISLGKKSR